MEYRVHKVSSRSSLRDFLKLPQLVYRSDPLWVAPLSSEIRRLLDVHRNPYFAEARLHLLVCYRDAQPVARTAIVVSRQHCEKFGVRRAFFGFFESLDDAQAVRCLFDSASDLLRDERIEILEGPFNPNHYSELGLQKSRFGTVPTFFQTYNPSYYVRLLEDLGFRETHTLFTAKNENVKQYLQQRYGSQPQSSEAHGYSVRSLDLRKLSSDLERLRCVFNDAFDSNWHFLPVSREEYKFSSKYLRLVTEPELIVIVEHEGAPVGVLMFVLDINPLLHQLHGRIGPVKYLRFLHQRRKINKLIIYAVGIRKSYQRTRVYAILLREAIRISAQYDSLETTWMSPENTLAMKAAERLGMSPDKYFGIFEKRI